MSNRARLKAARKTGWLSKRGGRIHTWHRRWFVLTGDLLFYHKSPQDTRPTGTIPLAGNRVIRHLDDPKQNGISFKFEIIAGRGQQLSNTHETYLISAESAQDADDWVAAIRRVMHEPYGGGMFGRSLEETLEVESRLGGGYIPILLHRCISFLHQHGLREVGIFRLPGQARRVQDLKELYDQGCQQDFLPTEDVHTVASLLKLFLRELPEPLVPFACYTHFQLAVKKLGVGMESVLQDLQRALLQLPKVNFNVIKYLTRFLSEVKEYSEENKMTALNLATIFGPHFLRPQTADIRLLMECNTTSTDFVCIAIQQHTRLFPNTADEKPPKRLSIVLSAEETPVCWADSARLVQRSLYDPQDNSPPKSGRLRMGSAPQNSRPQKENRSKPGVVASMVEQFNLRTTRSTSHLVDISPPVSMQHTAGQRPGGTVLRKMLSSSSVLTGSHSTPPSVPLASCSATDLLPEVSPPAGSSPSEKRFSGSGILGPRSETLSSEIIVNSISRELETLEAQLVAMEEEAARYKKAARLWKARYKQERTARLAAEERATGLQSLVDETFQQFALEDSEDDSFGEPSSASDIEISPDVDRTETSA